MRSQCQTAGHIKNQTYWGSDMNIQQIFLQNTQHKYSQEYDYDKAKFEEEAMSSCKGLQSIIIKEDEEFEKSEWNSTNAAKENEKQIPDQQLQSASAVKMTQNNNLMNVISTGLMKKLVNISEYWALILLKETNTKIFGLKVELRNIYLDQFLILSLTIIIRSFIVAVRYGFSSKLRFKVLRSTRKDATYVSQDLIAQSWVYTTPKQLDPEIDSVFWRNQIEEKQFFMRFYEELDEVTTQKFTDPDFYNREGFEFDMNSSRKEYLGHETRIRKKQDDKIELDPYDEDYEMYSLHSFKRGLFSKSLKPSSGRLVFREIAIFAGAKCVSLKYMLIILPIIKASLVLLIRYLEHGSPIALDIDGFIYQIAELPVFWFLTFANYLFVAIGLIDFQRRVFMIKAIGSLINPFKQDVSVKYMIFPTLVLTCKDSLHSWFNLRICAMDFGRKFLSRIFVYCSAFLGSYVFFVVILLLQFFNFIQFQLSVYLIVLILFDIFIILGAMLVMLYLGAVVNHQFVLDRLQLIKIKQTFLYMRLHIDEVRGGTKFAGAYLKIFQKPFIRYASEQTSEEAVKQIDDLISEIDAMSQRLELDGEHQPLRLMGLKATYSLMNQIYTTLFTIIFAVAQKLMS
ncbi:UNKNOWN [Stylonychia lemnae]|uniref:Transmembrane protein n=1 Tax=Stylonychia lemnae TaxID=5949 RepID=A0A078AVP9_STYLE|nr:UNKNOWN [Stylonychia lemnae]|eukprot:CDW86475.1 UNKNOWN [Stylonychia lemnae]